MTTRTKSRTRMTEARALKLARRVALQHMQATSVGSKTAGEIRFIKDTGPDGRTLPESYEYNPRAKKPLAKVLWSISVALGHLISAHSTFSKIKAVSISPDGKLGGSGFIQEIKAMRKEMTNSVEVLSALQDTLYDELRAPHWDSSKLDVPAKDEAEAEQMLDESDQISLDPDAFVEREYKEDVKKQASQRGSRRHG
ncbi:MAG: hypothetical protein HRT64_14425 [Erythrobacter sp.]|nr:hypothetical protein [Erythrobacter sp.]